MESHFKWPCAVDLRCAPLGPCLETHFERKLSLGHCFVLYFRATLRASLLPFSEIHSEWNIISNGKLDFWATLTRRLEAQGAQGTLWGLFRSYYEYGCEWVLLDL